MFRHTMTQVGFSAFTPQIIHSLAFCVVMLRYQKTRLPAGESFIGQSARLRPLYAITYITYLQNFTAELLTCY